MQRLVGLMVLGAIFWFIVIPMALLLLRWLIDVRNYLLGRPTAPRRRYSYDDRYEPNATDPSDFPELGP
ncbi:MAG TPA: hypothetical protein VM328_00360 [Fimbriimonadaceae bacterium]|nr:hypothetical protein [Fimbriimonadaceae bacterium]